MATQLTEFDVVIFYGPKYTGKSQFFTEKLSQTHVAVCPSDIFSKTPSLGIRDIMIRVTKLLREGKMIAIVDENASRTLRESYIKYINRKHPSKKICILELLPACGIDHLFWSREFSVTDMAARMECHNQDINMAGAFLDDSQIMKWFPADGYNTLCPSEIVDPPTKEEGVEIMREKIPLVTNSVFKFEIPVLYIQWESILGAQPERKVELNISKALNFWSQSNPCGRIIFIHDGSQAKTGEATLSHQSCEVRELMQNFVYQFTVCPLYLLHLENPDEAGGYVVPPMPGLLAFLQRRHHLNHQSKSSIYLYHTTNHQHMADSAGIQNIKVSRVIQNPLLVLSHHSSSKASIPPVMKDFQVKLDSNWSDVDPVIPLYKTRDKYRNCFTSSYLGYGRREYIFARELDIIERYQKQYAEKARRVNDFESIIDTRETCSLLTPSSGIDLSASISSTMCHKESYIPHDLPNWMLCKPSGATHKSRLCNSASVNVKIRQTEYVMTETELTSMAKEILMQAGREDLIEKAKSVHKEKRKTDSERNAKVCECMKTAVAGSQVSDNSNDFNEYETNNFAHHQRKNILDDLFDNSLKKKMSPKKKVSLHIEDVDQVADKPNKVFDTSTNRCLKKIAQHGNGDVNKSCQKTFVSLNAGKEDSDATLGNMEELGQSEKKRVFIHGHVKHELSTSFIESSRKRPAPDLSILDEIFS